MPMTAWEESFYHPENREIFTSNSDREGPEYDAGLQQAKDNFQTLVARYVKLFGPDEVRRIVEKELGK